MNMKLRAGFAVAALAVLALAGCAQSGGSGYGAASTSGSSSSSSSSSPTAMAEGTLSTASSSLGTIVVDGTGRTVYVFENDTANSGKSTCEGNCAATWPAVTTTNAPTGAGVTGKLGMITRPDGTKQVTLDGLPLYEYSGDSASGDVNGQAVGGIWWVVSPSGTKITSSTSGSGGSSGY